jgi:ATP-dependent DNA helicase MPH1
MILKPLTSKGVIDVVDPVRMHPYRAQVVAQRIGAQRNSPHKWAFSALSRLGALARAMGYLVSPAHGPSGCPF